jgi:hypothetical protein
MRTRVAGYVNVILVSATIILAPPFLSATALSGRVPHTTGPAISSVQTTSPPDRAKEKTATPGDGEYRLIFPTNSVGTAKTVNSEDDAVRASKFDSFVEQLSKAGAEGYRLTSFVYAQSGLPVGVVRRGAARYEYTWLAYRDKYNWLEGAGGGKQMFASLSKRGFRLADHAHVELYCQPVIPENTSLGIEAMGTECAAVNLFLLEREVGVERPARFAVLGWEEKPAVPATVEFKRKLSEGLFPKQIFSGYDIWFEEGSASDGRWGGDAEIELVWYDPSWWGSDTSRSVNKLAKRGYRVGLINWDTAVMYRTPGSAGFNYYWVDAKKKDFEKQLARLQAKGAIYISTYEEENKLIFERRLSDDGRRREYRILKFELQFEEDAGGNRVRIDLGAQGQESLVALRDLVREGFAVRDLFLLGKQVGAILERPLKKSLAATRTAYCARDSAENRSPASKRRKEYARRPRGGA